MNRDEVIDMLDAFITANDPTAKDILDWVDSIGYQSDQPEPGFQEAGMSTLGSGVAAYYTELRAGGVSRKAAVSLTREFIRQMAKASLR